MATVGDKIRDRMSETVLETSPLLSIQMDTQPHVYGQSETVRAVSFPPREQVVGFQKSVCVVMIVFKHGYLVKFNFKQGCKLMIYLPGYLICIVC